MPQRPRQPFEIRRRRPTPEIPAEGQPAASNPPSDSGHVVWRQPGEAERPETPIPTTAPTGGESLPDTSGGRICDRCGAYVVRPDIHVDWHRKLDRHIRLVQDVFQARGYVANGGDTATDGECER